MGYYPNLHDYKRWLCLRLVVDGVETDILLTWHGLGTDGRVLACAACAYRHYVPQSADAIFAELQVLTAKVFGFTAAESYNDLEARFAPWLEEAIVGGLTYWQKGL